MGSILCWSGGKDSTASLILAHQNGIKIDKVIMSEVMFDHEKGISGEDTEHIEWVYNVAKPMIESWGYSVEILRDKKDYKSLFNQKYTSSEKPNKNGKKYGFPLSGMCYCNNYLKMRPIRKYKKEHNCKKAIEYVGIAIDEWVYDKKLKKRVLRLDTMKARNKNAISLLEKYNYTELMALNLCIENNLLSPLYLRKCNSRQGCWFCPNRTIKQFADLYVNEPDKWQELVKLSKTENLYRYGFQYGMTIEELEKKILIELRIQEVEKAQMNMFEDWEVLEVENG